MRSTKETSKGITLIALVITIIILLILAGIAIEQLKENGLFIKAKITKEITAYTSAKEVINMKLMEIEAKCITENKEYKIKEIAENIEDKQIKIEKYFNLTDNLDELNAIVVSVNQYSKYKFLIGKECKIIGVLEKQVTETTDISEFKYIEEFEKEIGIFDKNQSETKSDQSFLILNGETYLETTIKEEDIVRDNQEFTIATRVYLNRKMKEQGEVQMGILGNHNNVSGFAWQFATDGKTLEFVMKNEAIAYFDYSSYYDKWTNLVATYNKGCIKVYVDGQLICEKNDKQFVPCGNLYIGTSLPKSRIFRGAIQTVKIWKSELSEAEVNQIDYDSTETTINKDNMFKEINFKHINDIGTIIGTEYEVLPINREIDYNFKWNTKNLLDINLDESEILENSELTIAAKVKINQTEQTLISHMGILGNHTSTSGIAWQFIDTSNILQFGMTTSGSGINVDYTDYYDKYTDIVMTYKDEVISVYMDGKKYGELQNSTMIPYGKIYLGCSCYDNLRGMIGYLPYVKIWNKALTQEEVNKLNLEEKNTKIEPNNIIREITLKTPSDIENIETNGIFANNSYKIFMTGK